MGISNFAMIFQGPIRLLQSAEHGIARFNTWAGILESQMERYRNRIHAAMVRVEEQASNNRFHQTVQATPDRSKGFLLMGGEYRSGTICGGVDIGLAGI